MLVLFELVGSECFRGYDSGEACVLHDEGGGIVARPVGELAVPEAVGIVAVEREEFAWLLFIVEFWPSRARHEWHVEA